MTDTKIKLSRLDKINQLSQVVQSDEIVQTTTSIESNNKNFVKLDPNIKTTSVINYIEKINEDFNGNMSFRTDILINYVLQQLKDDGILEIELKRLCIETKDISKLTDSDKNKILASLSVMV